jgi:hypothetical protein
MAKNTKIQNDTEEFIDSLVEKIIKKQSAFATTGYVQVLDKNGNPPEMPTSVITTGSGYHHGGVYGPAPTSVTEYAKQMAESVGCAAKKASPVDDALMNLEENIHHTYDLIQKLVKKLEPVMFVAPANDTPQEIKPQHSIPLCATIERNTSIVVNIKKEIEYLLEYVGV